MFNPIQFYEYGKSRYDVDAAAFLSATLISDVTIKNAINSLVVQLKLNGLWNKMKAIYPIVGGTAFTHKFNLKDPRDANTAFRLFYTGTQTHTVNGMTSNSYITTFLVPLSHLTQDSTHISFYSRTNSSGFEVDMGIAPTPSLFLAPNFANIAYRSVNGAQVDGAGASGLNTQAYFIASRITSGTSKLYRNNSISFTDSQTSTGLSNSEIWLMNYNGGGSYPTSRQCAFASIGNGLDDTEASILYTIVQSFQTMLGRQV